MILKKYGEYESASEEEITVKDFEFKEEEDSDDDEDVIDPDEGLSLVTMRSLSIQVKDKEN